jgi:ATP phosphoribosyltransferase
MAIRLALPKGRFLSSTANLLASADLGFRDYGNESRQYRLKSIRFPYVSAKIFQEKDIPIQVAVGNYDLGICGLDWIEELQRKYPMSALTKVSSLGYGEGDVHVVVSKQAGIGDLDELLIRPDDWRIVSEYPNLAESFALDLRIRKFRIFPVWGAAEAYPPENADLAILLARDDDDLESQGLVSLMKLLPVTSFLIANRVSLENKDLSPILSCLSSKFVAEEQTSLSASGQRQSDSAAVHSEWQAKEIKLALPDGHQQAPASQFLKKMGLNLQGYSSRAWKRRPSAELEWLGLKVIRPQDMPLQVANGNFDLAITGKDWFLEHIYRFPLSPVTELLDLGFGEVKIVAAISEDMPAKNIDELGLMVQRGEFPALRVVSEYINIADRYLRDNYICPYKLIPTWGASEAFLPEDADLLIDNAQTGKTLAQHKLKTIDVLFQSTACLIGNSDSLDLPGKKDKMEFIKEILSAGLP